MYELELDVQDVDKFVLKALELLCCASIVILVLWAVNSMTVTVTR